MGIRVALHHKTEYRYERPVSLGPQVVRLRPAPHCRTPIDSYSLNIEPGGHFLNWQQDPYGNFLARLVFPEKVPKFSVTVDLVADLAVINPFDFFVEESAEDFPFEYDPDLKHDLQPYLVCEPAGPLLSKYLRGVDVSRRRTTTFLVEINQKLQRDIKYLIRMEPGVQSCEETLGNCSGSCRDSAWLLTQLLRRHGLAARFVSGYLIQLKPDVASLDGPSGSSVDFTDLHAWTEVFIPGAGWIGLDPTSGLFCGEGHIPLAATPSPQTAAPISGALEPCETAFGFDMTVTRVREDPRVTKPYTEEQWEAIDALGARVDEKLRLNDVRLTMGGEPTFVSIDDQASPEWNTSAVGPHKLALSSTLTKRIAARFGPGGMLHFGQGKWYPGESLPRWAYSCFWRKDGEPIWTNPELLGQPDVGGDATVRTAGEFLAELSDNLGVGEPWIRPAYEDLWQTLESEQKLPVDVDPRDYDFDKDEDRRRLARTLERGLSRPVGYIMPLTRAWWQASPKWVSGPWPFRSERLFLIPGDSPIGLRLPLDSLPVGRPGLTRILYAVDPFADRAPLPGYEELRRSARILRDNGGPAVTITGQQRDARDGRKRSDEEPVASEEGQTREVAGIVRTALCIEPRNGRLHIFMPPVGSIEDYLELVACIEKTAEELQQPVILEGYLPPWDNRLNIIKVTPDPGVIEVNVHPAKDWDELKEITTGLYEEARLCRLGTEKFQLDGRHSGTGGGNHIVIGGATPNDSPFLRRPDLLRSLLTYWNNHPSLSYVFAGLFIGPTSQAPRVDEGRRDSIFELELAFAQIPEGSRPPAWLVDRVFRHLLVDLTGNTHRAEFCIDKLYSPDHAAGRLGLVELRGFEMPPDARMSLAQQLLVRALVAMFWERPCREKLIRWGTELHDRWMLPEFLRLDLRSVMQELSAFGFGFHPEWFAPHLEFRCPFIGELEHAGVQLEFRTAIEPWYVLGEEPGGGGTTRYVDSSVERMQVMARGLHPETKTVVCNGRPMPFQSTGTNGEYVAGVRYRAWQPPSCLHPTIPVHTPLSFDLVDLATSQSLGGCRYYVDHPGGLNPSTYPVNALEAESRRAARFSPWSHQGGIVRVIPERPIPEFPCTLDLRVAPNV